MEQLTRKKKKNEAVNRGIKTVCKPKLVEEIK